MIHINEVLPVLETIYEQQQAISERLGKLIETLKMPSEPVEPVLRSMLRPLGDGLDEMRSWMTSDASSENPSE